MVVLVALPYVASLVLYLYHFGQVWHPPRTEVPAGWQVIIISPLIVASLAPLTLAPKVSHAVTTLLAVVAGVDLILILTVFLVAQRKGYWWMLEPVQIKGIGHDALTYAKLTLGIGVAVILASAIVAVAAAASGGPSTEVTANTPGASRGQNEH